MVIFHGYGTNNQMVNGHCTNGGVSIAMFESPLWWQSHSGHVAPKIAIKNIGKIMFDIIDIPKKKANSRGKGKKKLFQSNV